MIKSANTQLDLNLNFQNALFEYTNYDSVRDKLAELLGELVSKEKQLSRRIDQLIKEEENYNE